MHNNFSNNKFHKNHTGITIRWYNRPRPVLQQVCYVIQLIDPHQQHQNPVKYPENGHDTLSDFVTFVCQEADNSPQNAQVSVHARGNIASQIL